MKITENLKPSHYNHLVSIHEDEFLLFNARTLATIELDNATRNKISFILNEPNSEWTELHDELLSSGFLLPQSFDEKQEISERLWSARKSKEFLSLTIAPTIGCNFNCPYCFESEDARANYATMTPEIQTKLIDFVENHIQQYGVKEFKVCWFGGEPLLGLDVIENLSQNFIRLSKKYDLYYFAEIISNGYKLTPSVAKKLKNNKVLSAQITIDGPACIHDNRRILKGGVGSFKRIVKNLGPASKELSIQIRVNVDKQNASYLEKMLEEIKQSSSSDYSPNIYLAPVHIDPTQNIDYQAGITESSFAEISEKFIRHGASEQQNFANKPNLVTNACAADHIYSYMIGPKGELYNCWEDFGVAELSLGSIEEGRFKNQSYLQEYHDFDPTKNSKCTDCTVMPLCMGGCPKRRLQHDGVPQCGVYKKNLRAHLLGVHQKLNDAVVLPKNNDQLSEQLNQLLQESELFYPAIPNNYVLMFVSQQNNLDEYLQKVTEDTYPLNAVNLQLLKICYELMSQQATDEMKQWAIAVKEEKPYVTIPFVKKTLKHIEDNVIENSMKETLATDYPEFLNDCIAMPEYLRNQLRLNVYLSEMDVITAFNKTIELLKNHPGIYQSVIRIEVAKMNLNSSENAGVYPRLIIYLKNTEKLAELVAHFQQFAATPIDHYFNSQLSHNATLTQGFRQYKQFLECLGLLEYI